MTRTSQTVNPYPIADRHGIPNRDRATLDPAVAGGDAPKGAVAILPKLLHSACARRCRCRGEGVVDEDSGATTTSGAVPTPLAIALGGVLADTVVRYAPVATVVNDFYWERHDGNLTAAYPADRIATAFSSAGITTED